MSKRKGINRSTIEIPSSHVNDSSDGRQQCYKMSPNVTREILTYLSHVHLEMVPEENLLHAYFSATCAAPNNRLTLIQLFGYK